MVLRLLEGRNPIADLEIVIDMLKSDIKFYEQRPLLNIDAEDAKISYRNMIVPLKN